VLPRRSRNALIEALGPLAAGGHGQVWNTKDPSEVFSGGEEGLVRILLRWNHDFHRRRHALPEV
jgi:hypothetical protein